jgi:cytochrome c oxidase assembly factor CtaG
MNVIDTPVRPATKKPGFPRWGLIAIGLLVAHMTLMITAVVVISRSKYEVVPDYYQKAVHWDQDHKK